MPLAARNAIIWSHGNLPLSNPRKIAVHNTGMLNFYTPHGYVLEGRVAKAFTSPEHYSPGFKEMHTTGLKVHNYRLHWKDKPSRIEPEGCLALGYDRDY